jgi:poly(3-hydroxybutyrate) depolymerase
MQHIRLVAPVAAVLLSLPAAEGQDITRATVESGGRTRHYALLVPDKIEDRAPLLVLLHGSGRDGRSIIDPWSSLARRERIILAAPDSLNRVSWGMAEDGPHFLYDLIEDLKANHLVDPRRVYLFGHSAGAIQALDMAILESEYFAAAAAHAGVISREVGPFIRLAARKIPIALWVGTNDPQFPVAAVRTTRDALQQAGFQPLLTEIPRHTHNYYGRANEINQAVWQFLSDKQLDADPKYKTYTVGG